MHLVGIVVLAYRSEFGGITFGAVRSGKGCNVPIFMVHRIVVVFRKPWLDNNVDFIFCKNNVLHLCNCVL
jgi:hypothetical protein